MVVAQKKPSDHAVDLLNGVLKQLIALGVASIGLLFGARGLHIISPPDNWLFYLSLAGFICCVILAVVGQFAIVSVALEEPQFRWFPQFLRPATFWSLLAWIAFAVAAAAFIFLVF